MFFIPTRNRPEAIQQLIIAMESTGCVPGCAVMVDGPLKPYQGVRWPSTWHIHHDDTHLELGRALNALFKFYPNEKVYGFLTDHARPMSADWATKLEEAAGDWGIALCDDTHLRINPNTGNRRLSEATCFGGKLCRAVGWVWPSMVVHLYGDDIWEEIGHELGLINEVNSVKVKSLLFSKGEMPKDDNHDRLWRGQRYDDKIPYLKWREEQKECTIAMLRHLMNGTKPITIACVKWGSTYGSEYVNNLSRMVKRNFSLGFPGKVVCFTDDPKGIDEGIEIRELPQGLNGWWNKLYLFKEGVFKKGERILYIDLDTLIVGGLDDICKYNGEFAILRDFYRPHGLGSGLMAWRGGFGKEIWGSFEKAGYPDIPGGDQAWIERCLPKADLLQDLYPGIYSFKAHCQPDPPKGAKIICFHGQPKPHNCGVEWVDGVWNGNMTLDYDIQPNTKREILAKNIKETCDRNPTWLKALPPHDGVAVIVGGGPSLAKSLPHLANRQRNGAKIFATNGTYDFLVSQGITPDYHTVIDARPENASFLKNGKEGTTYLLASQCAKESFEAVEGKPLIVFHLHIYNPEEIIPEADKHILVGGGSTVGLITINLAYGLGYSEFYLYGFDSSYTEGQHHAYQQTMNDNDKPIEVMADGRKFYAAPWMVAQTNEFIELSTQLANAGCSIAVAGDGLLPWVAHSIQQQLKEAI